MKRFSVFLLAGLLAFAGVVIAMSPLASAHHANYTTHAMDHAALGAPDAQTDPDSQSDEGTCPHSGPANARASHGCCAGGFAGIIGGVVATVSMASDQSARHPTAPSDVSEPIFGIFKPPRG